ncbi:TIGR03086 family metal-binding protein [Actinoplanes sp. NPDC051411]|uniref:TIGR03086 family metal-binding protein n=1 Tax=Actinoplanes sp. NPDC051411 TaxID=3155522 RepID=UPI00343CFD56
MRTINLLEADEAATRGSVAVVAQVAPPDLARPTPCARWDLRALLAHMTVQHRGFAAAAAGRGGDPDVWQPVSSFEHPVAAYLAATAEVLSAFAEPGVLDREFVLPEIPRQPSFPGRVAIGFHLVDYVVHGWDVAQTIGVPYTPPDEVVATALPVARAVPDGPFRLDEGAAFAPARTVPAGASALDEILLLLGRDPR